jgi:hypothetical protein
MRRATVICAVLLAGMLSASAASASPGTAAINDCNTHGHLTGHYTVPQLHDALNRMPAVVKEYTDCYDVIQRALLAGVAGSHPSDSGGTGGSGGSFLPTWLIVVLVLLALAAATLGAIALRRRGTGPPAG